MSTVLQARIERCLNDYGVDSLALSLEELAAEIELAVFLHDDDDFVGEPVWDGVVRDLGACINCLCVDCGCCVGCGDIDADIVGSHGYWCVL